MPLSNSYMHKGKLVFLRWNELTGKCRMEWFASKPCTGPPGYGGKCEGHYDDDYGSSRGCSECDGSGIITYRKSKPYPQCDAPAPTDLKRHK